jgi:hypothetical protein
MRHPGRVRGIHVVVTDDAPRPLHGQRGWRPNTRSKKLARVLCGAGARARRRSRRRPDAPHTAVSPSVTGLHCVQRPELGARLTMPKASLRGRCPAPEAPSRPPVSGQVPMTPGNTTRLSSCADPRGRLVSRCGVRGTVSCCDATGSPYARLFERRGRGGAGDAEFSEGGVGDAGSRSRTRPRRRRPAGSRGPVGPVQPRVRIPKDCAMSSQIWSRNRTKLRPV